MLAAEHAGRRTTLPPPLTNPGLLTAYQQIQLAASNEDNAAKAIDVGGYEAAGVALGTLATARLDLDLARIAVSGAGADASLAKAVLDRIEQARTQDLEAEDSLRHGNGLAGIDSVQAALTGAASAKTLALSVLQYGEEVQPVDLGCKLFFQQGGGQTLVGLDGCTSPVTSFEVQPWFRPTSFTDALVTTGGSFPCALSGETIECTPPQPLQPGQDVYLGFTTPASVTQGTVLAYAAPNKAQSLIFLSGTGRPTTNLKLTQKLRRVTPNGYQEVPRLKPSFTLSVGNRYSLLVDVVNRGNGTATGATVKIGLPPAFKPDSWYPGDCTRTSDGLTCSKRTLDTGYGGTIMVNGVFSENGTGQITSSVTSNAAEPTPDPDSNVSTLLLRLLRIPTARITKVSPSLLDGRAGFVSGTVPLLPMQLPREAPKKVQWSVLQQRLVNGKCAWLKSAKGGWALKDPVAGACSTGVWLPTTGSVKKWRALVPHLPPGPMVALVRVTSTAGLTGSLFSAVKGNIVGIKVAKPR